MITFVTGGCRSGKSAFALDLGNQYSGNKYFLATCPKLDHEMDERIQRHQEERADNGWQTIEEEKDLLQTISQTSDSQCVLIECITLWVNNLMYHQQIKELELIEKCEKLLLSMKDANTHFILVSNEVGLGVVPENALARQYRDFVGRANQIFAKAADEVFLLVSGIPQKIK